MDDILENVGRIERYVADLTVPQFEASSEKRDAVERCLQRISEAAAKLGDDGPKLMPDQPWADIRSFGNVLRHEYDDIDALQLWQIIKTDLPSLKVACSAARIKLTSKT